MAHHVRKSVNHLVESTVVDMLNQFRFADAAEPPPRSARRLSQPEAFTEAHWQQYRTSGIRVFALGSGAA